MMMTTQPAASVRVFTIPGMKPENNCTTCGNGDGVKAYDICPINISKMSFPCENGLPSTISMPMRCHRLDEEEHKNLITSALCSFLPCTLFCCVFRLRQFLPFFFFVLHRFFFARRASPSHCFASRSPESILQFYYSLQCRTRAHSRPASSSSSVPHTSSPPLRAPSSVVCRQFTTNKRPSHAAHDVLFCFFGSVFCLCVTHSASDKS